MNELVSIIVPIYNVEKYLDKCIKSIVSQTYQNLEIILVDDGSPDHCGEICDSFAKKDSRIIVIHKENGGLSSARNAGLEIAKGDYINFVDSDDYVDKEMIDEMMQIALKNSADIVICYYKMVNEDGDVWCDNLEQSNTGEVIEIEKYESQMVYFTNPKVRKIFTVAWNKMYKRELFNYIRFPVGRLHEDEAVTYRLLYEAKKVVYIKRSLYFYLERKGSIMSSTFNKSRFHLFDAYIDRLNFYGANNEKELYKKVMFLYMHMLCQYAEWTSRSIAKSKQEIIHYYNLLLDNINLSGVETTIEEKIELWLFKYFNVYKKLWKLKRGL